MLSSPHIHFLLWPYPNKPNHNKANERKKFSSQVSVNIIQHFTCSTSGWCDTPTHIVVTSNATTSQSMHRTTDHYNFNEMTLQKMLDARVLGSPKYNIHRDVARNSPNLSTCGQKHLTQARIPRNLFHIMLCNSTSRDARMHLCADDSCKQSHIHMSCLIKLNGWLSMARSAFS